MKNENIKLAEKEIITPCCETKKPLDAMKYHNKCIDCVTSDIGDTIDSKINELIKDYKVKTKLSQEEEKGVRKWLKHALTFIQEKV